MPTAAQGSGRTYVYYLPFDVNRWNDGRGEVVGKKGSIVQDQTDTKQNRLDLWLCLDPSLAETKFFGALNKIRPARDDKVHTSAQMCRFATNEEN